MGVEILEVKANPPDLPQVSQQEEIWPSSTFDATNSSPG